MRILIRAGKRPEDVLAPEPSFQRNRSGVFGANVGNLLFTNAVYRALNTPETQLTPDSMTTEQPTVDDRHISRINDEFDHFAIPLANAFRPAFLPWLNRLSNVIEQLNIPVSVIGVGAQLSRVAGSSPQGMPDKTREPVQRFMRAVLDRSAKVGVRGEFTREYLEGLGFGDEHVEVIGCPSMYEQPSFRVEKKHATLAADSHIGFNAVPSLAGMGELLEKHAAEYRNLSFIPQENRELALLLWGENFSSGGDAKFPQSTDHPLYREGRIRFFLDPASWRDYLRACDFSFGNRIHGNIAAITAGTPAVVLSHDSRTLELAQHHGIPVREIEHKSAPILASELYEWADFTELHTRQQSNFDTYTRFLESNGLTHIHQHGQANPEYEDLLARTQYPAVVRGFHAEDDDAVASRMRWLWQGISTDQDRYQQIYRPPFAPGADPANKHTLPAQVKKLESQNAALHKSVNQLQSDFNQLKSDFSTLKHRQERAFAWIPENSWARRVARQIRESGRPE